MDRFGSFVDTSFPSVSVVLKHQFTQGPRKLDTVVSLSIKNRRLYFLIRLKSILKGCPSVDVKLVLVNRIGDVNKI